MPYDMVMHPAAKPHRKATPTFVVAFAATAAVCAVLIGTGIAHRDRNEQMNIEQLVTHRAVEIRDVITRLISKTQALSALVIQGNGAIQDFDRIAANIVDDPAILNILVAPGGVVSHVHPLEGNEEVIGYSLFGDGPGNREAAMARDTGRLVFGGPFRLVQGGEALVGRLPVNITGRDGVRRFWGLVSVTLKYPDALAAVRLNELQRQGLAYELWRINPDDGERQIIAASPYPYNPDAPCVDQPVRILNTEWMFRVLPVRAWYELPGNWALIGLGLFISLLVASVIGDNGQLKRTKRELERLLCTDPLTGALNRTGLFREMERLIKEGVDFTLWYIDLNYFKQINDVYGHNIGDRILTRFTDNFTRRPDPGHVLARISGDEFALVCLDDSACGRDPDAFWEGVDKAYSDSRLVVNGEEISLSYAKGSARFPEDGDTIDDILSRADQNMYTEKRRRYSAEKKRRKTDYQRAVSPPDLRPPERLHA